jgi:NAD(P)H-hydrate epimerase
MAFVFTSAQMKAVDRAAAQEIGVPGVVLMENAGRGVADLIARRMAALDGVPVHVVCGAGSNGGDGFVIARHLANRGARVSVFLVAPRSKVAGDAAVHARAAERTAGVTMREGAAETSVVGWQTWLAGASVIVDAIYGTGLRADVAGAAAAAIAAMNASDARRIAVDLPSGLDADSGHVRGIAVDAHVTATMGCRKVGLVIDPAARVGEVAVVDIGVSMAALLPNALAVGPGCHWIEDTDVSPLLPRRPATAHKGSSGHVLAIAGSPGKTGAALLAARGAHRGGAGLVTVAATRETQEALDAKVSETMTAAYAPGDDADAESFSRVSELCARMSSIVIGPGIPTGPGMRALVERVLRDGALPVVADADALNLLGAGAPAVLKAAAGPRVLTPHPGEMARLLGTTAAEIQRDRLGCARALAAASGAIVVLKGARTIVAQPDGTAHVNPAADGALATAGSGDVLAGVIGALCAQGLGAADAARAGVFLHGEAAAVAARSLGSRNLVASDLPDAIARVIERMRV